MGSVNLFNKGKTFIIAEAGINHNGSIEIACRLIDAAFDAGVDAVKFQTFKTEKLVTLGADMAEYQKKNTGIDETQYQMLKRLELSIKDFEILNRYCQEKGILFLSTPFDLESVDELDALGVKLYKISSGDLTNMPLLKYVAQKNKPIILSTGMASLGEVEDAVNWIKDNGNENIFLLHCTSNYPTAYENVNLKAMRTLQDAFDIPCGYSDHTDGIEVPVAAAAMGAVIIEKHFTLDKDMVGPDHKASLEPHELRSMVCAIRNIERAMGNGIKHCTNAEENVKRVARKCIVAAEDILAGQMIHSHHITVKRPEVGIAPKFYDEILQGYRACIDIKADTPLQWQYIIKEVNG